MDLTGFNELEVGVSQKFRHMWWNGEVLRVEFTNRKGAEFGGAVYDYRVPEAVVNEISRLGGTIGASVGSYFHKEVVAQPALCPFVRVREAQ